MRRDRSVCCARVRRRGRHPTHDHARSFGGCAHFDTTSTGLQKYSFSRSISLLSAPTGYYVLKYVRVLPDRKCDSNFNNYSNYYPASSRLYYEYLLSCPFFCLAYPPTHNSPLTIPLLCPGFCDLTVAAKSAEKLVVHASNILRICIYLSCQHPPPTYNAYSGLPGIAFILTRTCFLFCVLC